MTVARDAQAARELPAALGRASNDMAAHFHESFRWMGNYGCGTKNGLAEFRRNWQLPLRAAPLDGASQLIPATTLVPAEDSARARLHFGWYPPERFEGVPLRWTCGSARAVLRAALRRRCT